MAGFVGPGILPVSFAVVVGWMFFIVGVEQLRFATLGHVALHGRAASAGAADARREARAVAKVGLARRSLGRQSESMGWGDAFGRRPSLLRISPRRIRRSFV